MTVPASMFRLWAASVKLAEVIRDRWSSMTMHLAWRQARALPSVASSDQDALPCLAKLHSVGDSLGGSPLLGQQVEHPSDMRWRHPTRR